MRANAERPAAEAVWPAAETMGNRLNLIRTKPVEIAWHSGLSIYASEAFLKTVGDEYGWLGGIDAAGNLRCVLPYTVVRKAFLRMVRFRVETIPIAEGLSTAEERCFLNSVVEHFCSSGASMIIPATTNTIFRTYPDGATAAPYGSYIINLEQPEETLWDKLHSKHRNVIRNAMKKGVEIQSGVQHLDTAYEVVQDTLKRSRLGFMRYEAFKRMVLGLGENVRIMIARHGGAIQGCAVIPFSGYSAYYVYGGSVPSPQTGAMNLLHWEAIKLFRGLGVKRYDFVGVRINPEKGTKQDGLMMFKERFGGELRNGYMWKHSLHRSISWAYSIGVRLLRGGDIVDQEKHKLQQATSFSEGRLQPQSNGS
jgi:hypothetical protein